MAQCKNKRQEKVDFGIDHKDFINFLFNKSDYYNTFSAITNLICQKQARIQRDKDCQLREAHIIPILIIVIMLKTVVRNFAGRWLAPTPSFTYIKKKLLDEIQKSHGTSWTQRLLMYTKQAKLIATHGFHHFKSDLQSYSKFYSQENIDKQPLSEEQKIQKIKIVKNLSRLKPIIFIQIMPFSAPLLIFYLFTYPTQVPTYLCLDQLFDLHQKQCVESQKIAITHFEANPLNREGFEVNQLELEQLKWLGKLLYGHYEDGVVGLNQYFKEKPKEFLFHPKISRHLVIRKLRQELQEDAKKHPECENMDLDNLVLWKYDQVMRGQGFVKFEPVVKELIEDVLAAKQQSKLEKEHQKESDALAGGENLQKNAFEQVHERHKPASSTRHSHKKEDK